MESHLILLTIQLLSEQNTSKL